MSKSPKYWNSAKLYLKKKDKIINDPIYGFITIDGGITAKP